MFERENDAQDKNLKLFFPSTAILREAKLGQKVRVPNVNISSMQHYITEFGVKSRVSYWVKSVNSLLVYLFKYAASLWNAEPETFEDASGIRS